MAKTVCVVGEAGVGKTALISQFTTFNYTLNTTSTEDHWFDSTPPASGSKVVNGMSLSLSEVPGSRGRMPNHYQVLAKAETGTKNFVLTFSLLFFGSYPRFLPLSFLPL